MRALPGAAGPPTNPGPLDTTMAPRIVLERRQPVAGGRVDAGLPTLCARPVRAVTLRQLAGCRSPPGQGTGSGWTCPTSRSGLPMSVSAVSCSGSGTPASTHLAVLRSLWSRRDLAGGSSSAGRAAAFQAACRGFEPRLPLHSPVSCSGRHDNCHSIRPVGLPQRSKTRSAAAWRTTGPARPQRRQAGVVRRSGPPRRRMAGTALRSRQRSAEQSS